VGIDTGDKGLEWHMHRSESTDHPEPERNIVISEGRRRRERSYRDQSMDDEMDAVMPASDRLVNRKQIVVKDSYEDDLLRSGGRTGEWVEEHTGSSGIKDLDMQGKYSFSYDSQRVVQLSQIPPDETSAAYQVRMIQI